MRSQWSSEVLVSAANLEAYRLVYEAETWLRRIVLASLLLSEGPAWASKLDPSLRGRLEAQSRRSSAQWVLGIDSEEELLWSATLGQLSQLLRSAEVSEKVPTLTKTTGEILAQRVDGVTAVRNALAHNRAISDDTLEVLRGDLVVVRSAVRQFKNRTLYFEADIIGASAPADLTCLATAFEATTLDLHGQQVFVSYDADFVTASFGFPSSHSARGRTWLVCGTPSA